MKSVTVPDASTCLCVAALTGSAYHCPPLATDMMLMNVSCFIVCQEACPAQELNLHRLFSRMSQPTLLHSRRLWGEDSILRSSWSARGRGGLRYILKAGGCWWARRGLAGPPAYHTTACYLHTVGPAQGCCWTRGRCGRGDSHRLLRAGRNQRREETRGRLMRLLLPFCSHHSRLPLTSSLAEVTVGKETMTMQHKY